MQTPSSQLHEPPGPVVALIVAGGRGRRFGGMTAKQYRLLAGVPLLVHTLRVFDRCPAVDETVLVVPAEDVPWVVAKLLPDAGLAKPVQATAGGASRQESVHNGLECIRHAEALVAIHDAVRPLVTDACIRACIEGAQRHGACIAALPAWDTLKRVGPDGTILATVPRASMWLAQTPQAFRLNLIREAHRAARAAGRSGTDDAELVEQTGAPVQVVPGSPANLKITTPEDLHTAELLLGGAPDRARPI